MTAAASATRPTPADTDPPISANDVEKLAMAFWQMKRKRPYASLSPVEQCGLWDHMRWVLQNAGYNVDTNAEWVCEVGPPEKPVDTAGEMIKLLRAAQFELRRGQPIVMLAIMSALDFVQRVFDEESERAYVDFLAEIDADSRIERPDTAMRGLDPATGRRGINTP